MLQKIKLRKIIPPFIFAITSLLFSVFTVLPFNKVEAATTPRYTVKFSYENTKIVSQLGTAKRTSVGSGNNVTSASVYNHTGNRFTFSIYMYGDSSSGSMVSEGYVGSTTVTIGHNSTFTSHRITVKNSSGTTVKSVDDSKTITVSGLSNGSTYSVEILDLGFGSMGSSQSTGYELSAKFSFTVDTIVPTMSGASTSQSGMKKTVPFTVSASDSGSGIYDIYYKGPSDSTFYSAGKTSSMSIRKGKDPGLYTFYAKDKAGNESVKYYVYYDEDAPVGKIYKSDGTVLETEYYNKAFSYKATDKGSGVDYYEYKVPGATTWSRYYSSNSPTENSTNGWYYFRAVDKLGNVSTESKVYLDTKAPSGTIYANSIAVSSGSKTTASSIYYTGSDSGCGIDACYVKASGASAYSVYSNSAALTKSGTYSFYCVDKAGNKSSVSIVLMDHDPPVLSCSAGAILTTVSTGYRITAKDEIGTATLYYQAVGQSGFTKCAGDYFDISVKSPDGKMYFYAVDDLGNRSATYWVELKVDAPNVIIVRNENEVSLTWNGNYTVTVNGQNYSKNTVMTTEGTYTVFITDNDTGRTAEKVFEIGHYYKKGETIAPTCTERGYTVYRCVGCSNLYYDDYTPATGHEYETSKKQPTCAERGYMVYTCKICGYTYIGDYVDAVGHNYKKVITEPTCTEKGYTTYTCTVCNYVYIGDYVPAKGHDYSVEVISPSCTERGYSIYTCRVCGYSYIGNYTSALGHDYVAKPFDPTCTERGGIRYACKRCGNNYVEYTTNELGHKFYEISYEPTCIEQGCIKHICSVCGYEYKTDLRKATGHTYKTWISENPTCERDGSRCHKCEICSDEYFTVIRCSGHEYEVTETEIDGGIKYAYECKVCGDSYVEYKGNHYEEVSNFVEYLFNEYAPYMVTVFLITSGVWSLAMGIMFVIATRSEDKMRAKKMILNYIIGLVVIFAILVACPYLVRGIAYLVAH